MVKQNDKLNYTAQGYANAETVGVVEDTTVFVPQMIVGEEAIVKVNYAKRNVAYADVVQLLKRSAKRKQPSCHYFGKCGGCALHGTVGVQTQQGGAKPQKNRCNRR